MHATQPMQLIMHAQGVLNGQCSQSHLIAVSRGDGPVRVLAADAGLLDADVVRAYGAQRVEQDVKAQLIGDAHVHPAAASAGSLCGRLGKRIASCAPCPRALTSQSILQATVHARCARRLAKAEGGKCAAQMWHVAEVVRTETGA